jgi:hypothetical protein
MKRFILPAFALAWLFGCETPAAAPEPESDSNRPSFLRVHDNFFLPPPPEPQVNSCPPAELVQIIDGRFHVNSVMETSPDGTQTFKVHFNAQGFEGVGLTSGDRYRIMDNDKVEVVITETSFDLVSHDRFRLIREGSLDNLWLRVHVQITDDGEPVFTRFDIECRG